MKKLSALAFATFLQGTSIGILIPVLTHFVLSLGADQAYAPMIFSTFSLFAFFSTILWGRISDSFGRRIVLIISAVGTVLSYLWLANATELWEIFASRALAGIMGGWLACAIAYVADVTDEKSRAKGMGLIGAFFGLGFVVGPAIGAILASTNNYHMAGWGATITALLSLIIAIFVIKEPIKYKSIKTVSLLALFKKKQTGVVLTYAFFTSIIFTAIEGSYALYIYNLFGASATQVGYVMILAGLANILMQGRGTYMISNRIGEGKTLILATLVMALGLASIIFISMFGMYIPMTIIGFGMGLYFPCINAMASRKAPISLKGSMSGAVQSIQAFARIIAPAGAGWLMIQVSYTAPYTFILVLSIIPLTLSYILRKA